MEQSVFDDLGRSSSLSRQFSQWKFTRSILPHPHFHSQPPHTGPSPDDPSSWSPGERVEEWVCLWWEEPRGALCMAALALPTEIESRGNLGIPESGVFSPGRAGPLTELQAQKSSLKQQGIVIPIGPATCCWPGHHCWPAPSLWQPLWWLEPVNTQELPMPQRSTSPKLAAQTELCWWHKPCYFHPNLASSPLPQVAGNSLQNNPWKNAIWNETPKTPK